jgi:hypothetical protein
MRYDALQTRYKFALRDNKTTLQVKTCSVEYTTPDLEVTKN